MNVLELLYAKYRPAINEFDFDRLWIPPMLYYLSVKDIADLDEIALSASIRGGLEVKFKMIDQIMTNRGFKKFGGGTNRLVYRHLEDDRFVAKIAIDKVGVKDNPNEYNNQFILKPFVPKMFEVSPSGTVGFAEKVIPIRNKAEFREVGEYVYDLLTNCILGHYIMDDIGTDFFLNYGIRSNFGPVILDYPYLFELDGHKLYCKNMEINPFTKLPTGRICDGEIDYDDGFNFLVCKKCNKKYFAKDLSKDIKCKNLIIEGEVDMAQFKPVIKRGNQIIGGQTTLESDYIKKPREVAKNKTSGDNKMHPIIIRPKNSDVETTNATEDKETKKMFDGNKANAAINIIKNNETIENESLYLDNIIDFVPSGFTGDYNQFINDSLEEVEQDYMSGAINTTKDSSDKSIVYNTNYTDTIDGATYKAEISVLYNGEIYIKVFANGNPTPISYYKTDITTEGWDLNDNDDETEEETEEDVEESESEDNTNTSESEEPTPVEEPVSNFQKERRADRRNHMKRDKRDYRYNDDDADMSQY